MPPKRKIVPPGARQNNLDEGIPNDESDVEIAGDENESDDDLDDYDDLLDEIQAEDVVEVVDPHVEEILDVDEIPYIYAFYDHELSDNEISDDESLDEGISGMNNFSNEFDSDDSDDEDDFSMGSEAEPEGNDGFLPINAYIMNPDDGVVALDIDNEIVDIGENANVNIEEQDEDSEQDGSKEPPEKRQRIGSPSPSRFPPESSAL